MMEFNPQQKRAIEIEGGPVLLSAGAGSGKTAVLTERIARLCLKGASIDRMLVVTFTNAAADEMRARIRKRLLFVAADPALSPDERAWAAEQADGAARADISTFHAFCGRLLRQNFALAGLDPAFRTADDFEAAGLRQEAAEAAIQQAEKEPTEGFCQLFAGFGGRGGRGLLKLLLRGWEAAVNTVDPAGYLEASLSAYDATPEQIRASGAYLSLQESWADRALCAAELFRQAEKLCLDPAAKELMADSWAKLTAVAEGLKAGTCGLDTLAGLNFGVFRPKKTEVHKEAVKALRERAKKLVSGDKLKTQQRLLDAELQAALLRAAKPQCQALCQLVEDFSRRYAQRKAEAGVVDFSDLEQLALKVLQNPQAAQAVREGYDWVFVDEYQDSSPIQEAILQAVASPGGLFCVGDAKQSIYRFRGAEPGIFARRAQRALLGEGVCLPLNVNYRTAAPLIRSVNDLFSRVMQDELHFGPEDALVPGRQESAAALTVHLLKLSEAGDPKEQQARLAARLIKAQKAGTLVENGEERPVRWSDFAVLLRTVSGMSQVYCRVFAQEGVPVFADLSGGYFDAVEVQVFLSLLRLVENRRNDVALLTVLRSGIGGFADGELTWIRHEAGAYLPDSREPVSYFDALVKKSEAGDPLGEKCRAFLALLQAAEAELRMVGLARFCQWLLERTGYGELVLASPGGGERMANLQRLLEKAQDYERASGRGLSGFLEYVDRAVQAGSDMGAAATAGGDCVRLLSIHRSKGLEFPIVLLANAERRANLRDSYETVLFPKEGVAMKAYLHGQRQMCETLCHEAAARAAKRAALNEEQRVL